MEGNIGDLKLECEGIVADLRSPQYATFQQDVDTIVEDLEERVVHIQELVSASEKFQSYCEEFGMPEVCLLHCSVTALSVVGFLMQPVQNGAQWCHVVVRACKAQCGWMLLW